MPSPHQDCAPTRHVLSTLGKKPGVIPGFKKKFTTAANRRASGKYRRCESVLKGFGFFPQHEFLDLARRSLRQFGEDDRLGAFEMRHVVAAKRDQIGFIQAFARLYRHERTRRLSPFFVRPCDYGRFEYGGMSV